ncbi:MAG: hypothetical protein HY356_07150 [Gammaproteobacteria bacterium]|nr:hypothetical protein [Gammaproteobacteria bacterium]
MMNVKFFSRTFTFLIFNLVLYGCAANLTPIEVSERFWTAVQNKDVRAVRNYVSSASLDKKDLTENILPIGEVSLGRTVIDGEQAWVDTTVAISGDDPFKLPLKTVLLQENKQWKVDYDATVASVSSSGAVARVMGNLTDLSRQFADGLDRSLTEIQKTLPQVQKEIGKIEENLRERIPELRQRMEEIMKQLEEALGNISRERNSRGTTEI